MTGYSPEFLIAAKPDREWAVGLYSMFGRGGDDEALYYVALPGAPWSKSRPRFARGRAYRPRDDLEAEQALRASLTRSGGRPFPGNVMLVCRFYRPNFQRIDADNLLKHVCDSANGVLWKDDSQVTFILAEVLYDPEHPRTIIVAGNHASTLTRGVDSHRTCVYCGAGYKPHAGPAGGKQRYCSTACAYADRIVRLEPINCRLCGKRFAPTTKTQVLCSRACQAEGMRGHNRSKGGPPSECTECGKVLSHRRGGRCRDCWRANPGFYAGGAA